MAIEPKAVENTLQPSAEIVKITDEIRNNAINNINSNNGLPSDFNPKSSYFFGQSVATPVKPSLEEKNYNIDDAYQRLNDGTYIAKYDTYKAGRDNTEYFGQTQSIGSKWLNGITKALGKTGTAVLGGTVGTVYGIGKAVEDGSLVSLYDNDFNRTMDDWNTKMDYNLPNYYTKQEQDKGLFGQALTSNFWADKVLGGLSFTAGALISESLWAYATGGASLGARAARWSTEAIGLSRVGKGINTYKELLKSPLMQAYRAGNISKNTAIALGKAGDLANTGRFLLTSAGYEASVEALQYKKEQTEQFYNNFAGLNGRDPSEQDIQEFENNLNNSANAVFGLNMAIVGSSNLVTMGKILDLRNPINTGVLDFIDKKAFGRGVQTELVNGQRVATAIQATRAQKIARNIFDYGKSPITEGLYEEGGQGVISNTAGKWLQYSYDPQLSSENIDLAGLAYESLSEQYGTKEGWVENGVGMIIGALGGTANVRAENQARQAQIEYKTAGLNNFTEKAITERMLAINRMTGASQEALSEEQKGNIVKSKIANDMVLHSNLNYRYQLGEDLNTAIEEARAGLDATTPEQFKAIGVEPEQIENYKETVLKKYSETVKQFKRNRKYSEYIIGSTPLIGMGEVTAKGDEALATSNQEALIQSLAWTLTAGENSAKLLSDIQNRMGQEMGEQSTNVLSVIEKVERQQSSSQKELQLNLRKKTALEKERDNLQQSLIEVQNTPNKTEGDRTQGRELGQLNIRLLEVEQEINSVNNNLQNFADELNSQKNYQEGIESLNFIGTQEGIVTVEDLQTIEQNLNKLNKLVESYRTYNPQKYQYIIDLIDEYKQAKDLFKTHQSTALAISSGEIKLKNVSGWLDSKLSKGKKMDEFTREWLVDTLTTYQSDKVRGANSVISLEEPVSEEVFNEFVDNNVVDGQTLSSIADKIKINADISPREQAIYKEKSVEIENIIKETPTPNVPKEVVENLVLTPREQLEQRLDNLLKKDFNSLTYAGTNYQELYLQKPTPKEIEEYRELKNKGEEGERLTFLTQKLSNWRLLDSAVSEENQSIADLIDLIEQFDAQAEEQNTQDELTPEDITIIASPSKDGVTETTVRYDLAQNTLANVTLQVLKKNNIYKLSHLKMTSVIDGLGIPYNSDRIKVVGKSGKQFKNVTRNTFENYSPGTIFYIDNTKINVGAGNTLEIKAEDFITLQQPLNLQIENPSIDWSYFDVYETVGETSRKRPSDFQEDINPQVAYSLKPGDKVGLQIANDSYNNSFRGKEITPELEKEIQRSLKIYLVKNGQPIAVLKATNTTVAPTEQFLMLREQAKQAFLDGRQLNASVTVKKVLLGSPEIIIENGQRVSKPIKSSEVSKIISTGYSQNGQLTLSREVSDIDRTYLSGINNDGKKLPVIVFKKGAYNVAYPVSLIKSPSTMVDSITNIVNNTDLTDTQKIKEINQRIIETGIASNKRLAEYNPQQIDEIIQEFSKHQTFVSMEDFSSPSYNFQNLTSDVLINIDLSNLDQAISVPKIEIDLNSIDINLPTADKYNNLTDIQSRLSDIAIELDNDFTQNADTRYVNSRGEIVEGTVYTDVFDEGLVEKNPKSHLDKIRNTNALTKAFSQKLPNVVKNALSPKTIQEVEFLLKKIDFLKRQTTPDREESQKIIDDNTCQ